MKKEAREKRRFRALDLEITYVLEDILITRNVTCLQHLTSTIWKKILMRRHVCGYDARVLTLHDC